MSPIRPSLSLAFAVAVVSLTGCSLFPETRHRDSLHNPFPQMKRVAVLPFTNQSESATLNMDTVTSAYYSALQAIPGFEVMPVGVAKRQMAAYTAAFKSDSENHWTGRDFQQLAKAMGVEAVVIGSVTDFDPYYPPRMAMTTNWYSANEGFHPIPAGYGLPWGTDAEKQIPRRIVREAEFELARNQLATQSPAAGEFMPVQPTSDRSLATEEVATAHQSSQRDAAVRQAQLVEELSRPEPNVLLDANGRATEGEVVQIDEHGNAIGTGRFIIGDAGEILAMEQGFEGEQYIGDHYIGEQFVDDLGNVMELVDGQLCYVDDGLPAKWPEPTDLIPDPPSPTPPPTIVNHAPVLTHTKLYRGDDSYFTNRLADHVETGDDARTAGWQGYLRRSDDFIRFCCHLHITEMLESRGGSEQSDLILRWPLSRY